MWPRKSGVPPDKGATSSNSVEYPPVQICDSVYELRTPLGPPEIEIVFIHGLQLFDYSEAYRRAWIAGEKDKDGREICWPIAWLGEEFPRARILSIKYNLRTMGISLLGNSLVQEMVDFAYIGQHKNCPVVFVCHCIGGLVAKEIVRAAHGQFKNNPKYVRFLRNIRGFHFYATPHQGSKLAELATYLPYKRGIVDFLRVIDRDLDRQNSDFERIERDCCTRRWQFSVVAETHKTNCYGFSAMVVEEASARHVYNKVLAVDADHFGVCKPVAQASSSYLSLKSFVASVVLDNKRRIDNLLELPNYVVGMDSRVKEVCKKFQQHSVIALVGTGGVGKTTLSKCVFYKELDNFERYCFLEDVKSRGNIEACQRQLFHALCGGGWDDNKGVNYQLAKIKECIISKKVLLVVDDVGDEMNMRALQVPAFIGGMSGSKVIVTTRRLDILIDFVNQEGIMDVGLLNEDEASELFSYYAFSGVEESVRRLFYGQREKIVHACGALPLSLEVIGQFLRNHNRNSIEEQLRIWEDALEKLRRAKPLDGHSDGEKVRATLKISYDNLSSMEQRIFLDMACILCRSSLHHKEGWWSTMLYRDTLERIWNSPLSIQCLTERSFIKWSADGKTLVIHDELQNLARGIVIDEADGNKSRIWDSDEGLQFMLQKRTVSKTLEGLCLGGVDDTLTNFDKRKNHIAESLNLRRAERFDHLRLLNLLNCGDGVVQYHLQLCTEALRWVALNESHITESSIQDLRYLKGIRVLHMQGCKDLMSLPTSIDNLSLLMELDLSFCEQLKNLPRSIGRLQKLQVLKLFECDSLKTLPRSIGNLSLLSTLDLSYCGELKSLPKNIGGLQKLQTLKLFQCNSLETLPTSIGKISLLTELDLSYCSKMKSLPESIGRLQNLQILKLRGWYLLETLPMSVGNLSLLTELDLSECYKLKILPNSIGGLQQLRVLQLIKCTSLETLPKTIDKLACLEEIKASGCGQRVLVSMDRWKALKLPASKEQLKQQKQQVEMVKVQPELEVQQEQLVEGLGLNRRVGDVEEEGGRRLRFGSKHFYNFLVIFFILLEPLLNSVRSLTNHGRFVLGLLMQWIQIPAGNSGQQVSSYYKCRVKSKDLILGRFLGQGCSGIFYETTLSGSHENAGRLARKLFPGVKGDVFESEVVRLFALTGHPNIVKHFCWTVDNRSCSLVMEYASDNLSTVVRKKKEALRKQFKIGTRPTPFQFPQATDILLRIAIGVRHLHSQGIYHGDLKPNNVLIDLVRDPILVKLVDFGLIKTKRKTNLISQRTLCYQMIGWSAPELVKDYIGSMSEDLDSMGIELDMNASSVSYDKNRPKISMKKADSYSFALLCVYVLKGKVWDANLSANDLRKQFGLRPELPSGCPEELKSLILSCWNARPRKRPTFSFICDKLEKIVNGPSQQWEEIGKNLRQQPEESTGIHQRARGAASAAGERYEA